MVGGNLNLVMVMLFQMVLQEILYNDVIMIMYVMHLYFSGHLI